MTSLIVPALELPPPPPFTPLTIIVTIHTLPPPPSSHYPQGKRLLGKVVLWRILFICTLMVILIEAVYYWGQTLGHPLCELRSEAFNLLVFMEIGYAWTCR